MTVWDWINNYRLDAQYRGDSERMRLGEFHPRAYAVRELDPDRALSLYDEGRRLALLLHEPLWVLFFDHWRVTMLLWFKQDYESVLEPAIRNALEARKPIYDPLNLRVTILRTLLCVYQALDLHGYAHEIRTGLDELEKLIGFEGEEKYLLHSNRIGFHYTAGEYAEAREACMVTLRWADQDGPLYDATHHSIYVYALLCGVAWQEQDWDDLERWCTLGAEATTDTGHRMEAIEFLVWQAVLARHAGEQEQGERLRRQARDRLLHLGVPPSDLYHDAVCAYHALGDDWPQVLKVRRRELARLEQLGSHDEAVRCRIKICRALIRLNQPIAAEVETTRRAASTLRAPQVYFEELERLLREEGN